MVEVDRAEDRTGRLCNDVRGIEAPAQANFEDQQVGWRLGKGEETRRLRRLEMCDRPVAEQGSLDALEAVDEIIV